MVTADEFITTLEELDNWAKQRHLIAQSAALLTDDMVQNMKARANDLLLSDNARSLNFSYNIIYASKVSGQPLHKALGLIVQGNVWLQRGQYRKAIMRYDKAQQVAQLANSPVEAARSQIGKIGALIRLGLHQQAIALVHETARVLIDHKELVSAARVYLNAGCSYTELEQPEEALLEFKKVIDLLGQVDEAKAQKELGMVYYNISMAYCNMEHYQEALKYSLQACKVAQENKLVVDEALLQLSAALCYNLMGNYNKALRLLHHARDIFRKQWLIQDLTNCEYLMCDCYLEVGRYEEAAEHARALIKLLQENEMTEGWPFIRAYHSLGRALMALGDLDEAAEALLLAQSIAEKVGALGFKQRTDLRLAELYLTYRNFAQAEKAEELLKPLLDKRNGLRVFPTAQLLLARIVAGRGEFEEAICLVQQSIEIFQEQDIQGGLYQAYYLLAEISEARGEMRAALDYLNCCISQVENLRNRIAAETRSAFLRPKESAYENAIALSLFLGEIQSAFDLVERIKSRTLVELMDNQLDIRIRVHPGTDRRLVEELEQLRLRHNELSWRLSVLQSGNKLAAQLTRSVETPSRSAYFSANNPEYEGLVKQRRDCEKRLLELTEQLQVSNALYYAEDVALTTSYRAFDPSILQPNEALIEYYLARGELRAFVVTRDEIKVVPQSLTTLAKLTQLLSMFRLNRVKILKDLEKAGQMSQEAFRASLEQLVLNSKGLFQKLYLALFAPIEPFVEGYPHLRIVPHGSLHHLPFHALYDPVQNKYLLEVFEEISYLPAANLLRFCRERARQGGGKGALILGFSNGGELPATLEEARLIAETLQDWGKCRVRLDDDASLENFRAEASHKRLLHLATHGRYRNDAPLFSSLLLAGGELTAYELFNMELQASLLTLSCCDSGLGTISGGDEILGLSRACLYAGAQSLVLSLWRVEDQAGSLLMQEFYRNLLTGQGKAAALRKAQLTLLNHPIYQHPFYWAPFVLIGDTGRL